MPFGFFKKKEDEKPAAPGAQGPGGETTGKLPTAGGEDAQYSADKAEKFYQHARTAHDSSSFEYASSLWLQGLRWDPGSMTGLDGFFRSASSFNNENPKGYSKDTIKQFEGRTDVDRYLAGLLAWANSKFEDAGLAVRATEAAAKLALPEATHRVGSMALNAARLKGKKDHFIKLKDCFQKVGAFDKAVEAGEAAVRVDPADGQLASEIRNLAAQATMSRGGYESSGQAGGFRANVKDLERQRQLEDAERIVKTEDTLDRLINDAKAEHQRRPGDIPTTQVLIKRLLERGKDEDERLAREIAKNAYEQTKEFRFRETFGDINLRRKARKLAEYKHAAAGKPDDAQVQDLYRRAREQFLKEELEEFKLRVDAYPTDQKWKFEVARRAYELGDIDTAIPLFQQAQQDTRYRVQALSMLGEAFLKIDYVDEALQAIQEALEAHKVTTDDVGMGLNYSMMVALQAKAQRERDVQAITTADKIASTIAMQQFNYRDIRQRRDAIKKLLAELRAAPQG